MIIKIVIVTSPLKQAEDAIYLILEVVEKIKSEAQKHLYIKR